MGRLDLALPLMSPAGWFGVDISYVLASLTVIGVSGFLFITHKQFKALSVTHPLLLTC